MEPMKIGYKIDPPRVVLDYKSVDTGRFPRRAISHIISAVPPTRLLSRLLPSGSPPPFLHMFVFVG